MPSTALIPVHAYLTKTKDWSPLSRFLLERGKAAASAPLGQDEQALFTRIDWGWFKEKQCYYNSLMLMLELDEPPGLTYMEGLAVTDFFPMDHAWLELNGKVIDPTWGRLYEPPVHPILGEFPSHWEYWGVPIPFKTVCDSMLAHSKPMSILDDWECHFPFILGGECTGGKRRR